MPQTPATLEKPRKPVTVEQLLQLKRAEQPDDGFWEAFEGQMQQRMLHNLVSRKRSLPRRLFGQMHIVRHAVVPAMAALLVAVGFSLQHSSSMAKSGATADVAKAGTVAAVDAQPMSMYLQVRAPSIERSYVAPVDASASQHFVVDSLRLDPQTSGYMKVMATETFSASPAASTRYAADPLGTAAGRILATTPSY